MLNSDHFTKFRLLSFTASGLLMVWFFFDANLSKSILLKDLGLINQQILAYVLVALIIFSSIESIVAFQKMEESSYWKPKFKLTFILLLPISAIIISYPKLVLNTFLQETGRIDIFLPIIASIFTTVIAIYFRVKLEIYLMYYKNMKVTLPLQVLQLVALASLGVAGIISLTFLSQDISVVKFPISHIVFGLMFILFFYLFSPKQRLFNAKIREKLSQKAISVNRGFETAEYIASLRKPPAIAKNKIHKRTMKKIQRIDEEERKSLFSRFVMLKEISFTITGDHVVPNVEGANDNENVLRVNFIKKGSEEIIKSEDVKLKYVKLACEQIPKPTQGNDIRSFLTPMSSKAYSIHLFYEHDPNELLCKFASDDETLTNLKELVKKRNPDINYVAENGWTPILIAVANGQSQNAKYLLQKAADPNIANKHGISPLLFASKYGNESLCKLLIRYKANIDQKDANGLTALMIAARHGHSSIVKLLIDNGANSLLADDAKKTALNYAELGRHGDICKLLRSN